MDKLSIDLQFETDADGRMTLVGADAGEPEKALIVERAMELAAIEGRPEHPQRADFERAARELSADSKFMDRGSRDIANVPKTNDFAESADARDYAEVHDDGTRRSPEEDASDEAIAPDELARKGVEDATNEQMLAGRKKRGVSGGPYAGDDT